MVTKKQLLQAIINYKTSNSVWAKAVKNDALDLIMSNVNNDDDLCNEALLKKALLNGADNWTHYSYSGCALCYDCDIAKHYCTKSELKKTDNGRKAPNSRETWLDVQARALFQADLPINHCFVILQKGEKSC